MKIKDIVNYLIYYQKWRRGAKIEQPNPTGIGEAIDGAIRELRNFQRLKENGKLETMKKIIRHGTQHPNAVFLRKCCACGCQFEYERQDVLKVYIHPSDYTEIWHICCPECGDITKMMFNRREA